LFDFITVDLVIFLFTDLISLFIHLCYAIV
jgi:hypothetical protein